MDFTFTEDQRLFQSTVRDLLEKECAPSAVRAAWASGDGRVPGLWAKLASTGVVGMTAAESAGGLGMDEVDLVLLLEEAGRAALPEPLLETTAVALPLLRGVGEPTWSPRIAAGDAVAAVAFASEPYVAGAGVADVLVLESGDEVWLVERGDVTVVEQPAVDRGRRVFSVARPDGAGERLATGGEGRALLDAAFDRAALGAAAHLVGLADQIIAMTAEYAKQREQFGRAIGSFQAVKHHLANALLRLEFARPAVYRAAHSVATGDADRARDVSMAKVFASDAALLAARVGLQVHGAIGYTWEHDLHLWMKPAWSLAASYGDAAWHRRRVARALGVGPD
jgi:alkylation response protein AidB-like acyl-CoA dehydrogenase